MTPIRRQLSSAFAAAFLALALLGNAAPALAQTTPGINPPSTSSDIQVEVPIPQSAIETGVSAAASGTVKGVSQYISLVYNFAISIVGLVAAVMMIIGGFQYLTSAGDASKIGAAKKRVTDAIIGLVLALGSFALLNSLNPQLVNLKPLMTGEVKTELHVLPWCDDLKKSGVQVTPYFGSPDKCGSVGSYTVGKAAGSNSVCIYRGPCKPDTVTDIPTVDSADFQRTCVQTLTNSLYFSQPLDAKAVLDLVNRRIADEEKNNNHNHAEGQVTFFADCKSCLEFGTSHAVREEAQQNGAETPTTPARCSYWQSEANLGAFDSGTWGRVKAAGKPIISYCGYISDLKGCAQVDFACSDPPESESCGKYGDAGPMALFDTINGGYQTWIYGSKVAELDSRPDTLQDVCFANPCGYNAAKLGCTGSTGLVDGIRTAAAAVRDGIMGIQSCENK